MNGKKYSLAGWLSIVMAIIFVPRFGLVLLLYYVGLKIHPIGYVIDALLTIILIVAGVYLFVVFRNLLNERFNFHEVDNLITSIIWLFIVFNLVRLLDFIRPETMEVKMFLAGIFFGIYWVWGIVSIVFAVRLLRLKDDLFGMLKPYAYTTIAGGVCVVSAVLIPFSVLIVVASYIMMGIIFLRAAEDAQFV